MIQQTKPILILSAYIVSSKRLEKTQGFILRMHIEDKYLFSGRALLLFYTVEPQILNPIAEPHLQHAMLWDGHSS